MRKLIVVLMFVFVSACVDQRKEVQSVAEQSVKLPELPEGVVEVDSSDPAVTGVRAELFQFTSADTADTNMIPQCWVGSGYAMCCAFGGCCRYLDASWGPDLYCFTY
jgi:hypothetical protein